MAKTAHHSGICLFLFFSLASSRGFAEDFPNRVLEASKALAGQARAAALSKAPLVLRCMTYNIRGPFPWNNIVRGRKPIVVGDRFAEIGQRLARLRAEGRAPHIVAIQEAFHNGAEAIIRESGYPYWRKGTGAPIGKLVGSGLYFLSEYPIVDVQVMGYRACAGWDCLAYKGVQRVRVRVPGMPEPLEIYNTHLNANMPGASQEQNVRARLAQIEALGAYFKRMRKGPAFVLGDFNTMGGWSDYKALKEALGAFNAAQSSRSGCTGKPPGQIWMDSFDHQFFMPDSGWRIAPSRVAKTFTEPFHGAPLSDHDALEAHYLLFPPEPAGGGAAK